jgi:hypothetical protein
MEPAPSTEHTTQQGAGQRGPTSVPCTARGKVSPRTMCVLTCGIAVRHQLPAERIVKERPGSRCRCHPSVPSAGRASAGNGTAMRIERLQKLRLRICRRSGEGRTLKRSHKPGLFTSIQVLCCARGRSCGSRGASRQPFQLCSETERYAASSAALFHLPERQLMQIPLQINSEHADLSQAARAAIEHEVERLEKCEYHVTGCRVAVAITFEWVRCRRSPRTSQMPSSGDRQTFSRWETRAR